MRRLIYLVTLLSTSAAFGRPDPLKPVVDLWEWDFWHWLLMFLWA